MRPVDPPALLGAWTLARDVHDRRTGTHGTVTGSTTFTRRADGGVDWDERGSLRWSGRTMPVSRGLRVSRQDGEWWVSFADGRPFHPWRPGAEVLHRCAEDLYRGTVWVAGLDGDVATQLHVLWEVTGPSKDQRIESRLHRTG